MPLNTNIALGVQTPQFESPMKMALVANQLRESQMKAQEYEAAAEERNRLRALNPADPDYANQLMRVSPTQGIAYQKSLSEKQSAEATRTKTLAEAAAVREKMTNQALRDISSRPSDANITAHLEDVLESNLYTAQEKAAVQKRSDMLLQMPFEERKSFLASQGASASELKPTLTPQNLGGTVQVLQTPAFGGAASVVPGSTGAVTQTPAQIAQDKRDQQRLALEGQRVNLEGQRVQIAQRESERKIQGLEALPPKEIQKREAALPQATAAVKGFEAKSTAFVNDLIALRDHPGLSEITGFAAGRLPGLTSAGRAAQALYDKVVAKGGFQALQDMRDASKTGGALGNVSNQEGKQLTASFAAIDRKQDAPDVQAAINQAIGDIEGAKVRMKEAYDSTYAYKAGTPTTAAPPKAGALSPAEQAELEQLRNRFRK